MVADVVQQILDSFKNDFPRHVRGRVYPKSKVPVIVKWLRGKTKDKHTAEQVFNILMKGMEYEVFDKAWGTAVTGGLRSAVIRLAHERPELRQHLVPALRRAFCGCPKCAAGTTKEEWEKALKADEASLKQLKADIQKLERGEEVENLTLEGAKAVLKGLTEVIANKKKLLLKLGSEDEIEAGRQHAQPGKGYGNTGPDKRGPGKWQPEAKGKCYYQTGDEADRCYVTQNGGPGGQSHDKIPANPKDKKKYWKTYEQKRWDK